MDAKAKSEAEWLSEVVLGSLDEEGATPELARRAFRSRTHFYRLFRALIDESPGAMRRRLLLERAAWQMAGTRRSVTEIAFDAQFGSLEAFSRAFRRGFGVSPSLYRRMGATHFRLVAPNGIHFLAPGSPKKGAADMDLFDRFAGHDSWLTRRLLEAAAKLTDEQLDHVIPGAIKVLPWEKASRSLRDVLERLVYTKEVWTAALAGRDIPCGESCGEAPPEADRSPAGLLSRYEKADAEFMRILGEVRDRGGWDDVFVDALCEPPETFTFGGMFAHLITFIHYHLITSVAVLRSLGVNNLGMGCPTEYEAEVAPWRADELAARK